MQERQRSNTPFNVAEIRNIARRLGLLDPEAASAKAVNAGDTGVGEAAGHVSVRAGHCDTIRLRGRTGVRDRATLAPPWTGRADAGRAKLRRTQFMTEESETLPTMVGEAGLDASITARELELSPTYAYEPSTVFA